MNYDMFRRLTITERFASNRYASASTIGNNRRHNNHQSIFEIWVNWRRRRKLKFLPALSNHWSNRIQTILMKKEATISVIFLALFKWIVSQMTSQKNESQSFPTQNSCRIMNLYFFKWRKHSIFNDSHWWRNGDSLYCCPIFKCRTALKMPLKKEFTSHPIACSWWRNIY